MKYLLILTAAISLTACGVQYTIETPYGSYTDTLDGKLDGQAKLNLNKRSK